LYSRAKEEEMSGAGEEKRVQDFGAETNRKTYTDGGIILNWILNQQDKSSWNG
jgi:hypothetical protein